MRAKTAIVLSLGTGRVARLGELGDSSYHTAKELWEKFANLYTTANTQVLINLQRKLDRPKFREADDWDHHVENFNVLLGKLASYDAPFSNSEKASKLVKTIPESLAPLALFSEVGNIPYDKLFVTVAREVSHRKSNHASKFNPPHSPERYPGQWNPKAIAE